MGVPMEGSHAVRHWESVGSAVMGRPRDFGSLLVEGQRESSLHGSTNGHPGCVCFKVPAVSSLVRGCPSVSEDPRPAGAPAADELEGQSLLRLRCPPVLRRQKRVLCCPQ